MMDDRTLLLHLAREAIDTAIHGGEVLLPDTPWLQAPGAVFVTLRQQSDGALRGCVGSIEPHMPLGDAVVSAARAAAFRDARFAPLSGAELAWVRLEVSVLSPLTRLPIVDEVEACLELERRRPGVFLRYERRQSVLLPKVWTSMRDAAEFLRCLKLKAGLPPTFWSEAIELHVFSSREFAETAA